MEDYKSNSDKARQEQQSEKKVEAVITGAAKTRKKGEMQKFADVFIAEDANNVKSYILMDGNRHSVPDSLCLQDAFQQGEYRVRGYVRDEVCDFLALS